MQAVVDFLDQWDDVIRLLDVVTIVVSLFGIPAILLQLLLSKKKYKIFVECIDGEKRGKRIHIRTIRVVDLRRGEILGIVGSKKERERDMDFSEFNMENAVKKNTVVVPLKEVDFNRWDVVQ